jgi:hypothetical protein
MTRHNYIAMPLALALALGALVSGCGGDSKKTNRADAYKAPTAKADPFQQAKDDVIAKTNARNLSTQMEACYVDQMTYVPCTLGPDGKVAGSPTGLAAGTAAGQVHSTATAAGYVITAKSTSGNAFVLTKDSSGASKRTCTTSGQAGCPATGSW